MLLSPAVVLSVSRVLTEVTLCSRARWLDRMVIFPKPDGVRVRVPSGQAY
jgi:hypothetical protein